MKRKTIQNAGRTGGSLLAALVMAIGLSVANVGLARADASSTFSGTVTDYSHDPVTGIITLALTSTDDSSNNQTATADEDGHFSIDVAPDTYTVSINRNDNTMLTDNRDYYETYDYANPVTLDAGSTNHDFQLPERTTLLVQAKQPTGDPMPDTNVIVNTTYPHPPELITSPDNPEGFYVTESAISRTDDNGETTISMVKGTTVPARGLYVFNQMVKNVYMRSANPVDMSGPQTVAMPDGSVPEAPTNLQVSVDPNNNNPSLTWQASPGPVDDYAVYRDGQFLVNMGNSNTTSFEDPNDLDGRYTYQVYATNDNGTSLPSDEVSVDVGKWADSPTIYDPGQTDPSAPTVAWEPYDHATSYNVYRNGVVVANTTDLQFTDNNARSEYTYSYEVTAITPRGENQSSEPLTFTIP